MGKNKDRLLTKSIPWADSILEQVINLPAAGGEDLQSTAEAQTLAVENLLKMVNRKVAENRGEGQYVWKKSETTEGTVTNPTIYIKGTAASGAIVTSDSVDLALVDESFFDGFTYSSNKFSYTEAGGLKYIGGGTTYEAIWDGENHTITVVGNTGSFSGTTFTYTGNKTVLIKGDFVEFVVSTEVNAYPNGGVQGGAYYAKFDPLQAIAQNIRKGISIFDIIGTMSEGVSGVDFGTTTLSSNSQTITVNHSIGSAPTLVVLLPKNIAPDSNYFHLLIQASFVLESSVKGYGLQGGGFNKATTTSGNSYATYTSTTVKFDVGANRYIKKGTYVWIAVKI